MQNISKLLLNVQLKNLSGHYHGECGEVCRICSLFDISLPKIESITSTRYTMEADQCSASGHRLSDMKNHLHRAVVVRSYQTMKCDPVENAVMEGRKGLEIASYLERTVDCTVCLRRNFAAPRELLEESRCARDQKLA